MPHLHPLSLRLCCLAAMAPALTSEASSRARDKLVVTPPDPDHPHPSVPRGGEGLPPPLEDRGHKRTNPTQTNPSKLKPQTQLVSLTGELTQRLLQGRSLVRSKIVSLGTITNLADICKQESPKQSYGVAKGRSMSQTVPVLKSTAATTGITMTPRTTTTSELNMNKPASTTVTTSHVNSATPAGGGGPDVNMLAPTNRPMSNGLNSLSHSRTPSQAPHTITAVASSSTVAPPDPGGVAEAGAVASSASSVKVETLSTPSEMGKHQRQLDARTDRLLRRLRRLQTRQAISHARQQMSGFVDHQHRNLETVRSSKSQSPTAADLIQSRDVKNLSTAALVNLVQKLQSSQPITLRQHLAGVNAEGLDQEKILRLDDEICTEFDRMAGHLSSNLHHLESAVDSDATESSSGGESCDELDYDYDWDGKMQQKPSIAQRAEWKWAVERAAVASRWTWLQAQVSDLEYRIRQQNDIYRQIRASKGAVVLGDQVQIEDLVARFKAQQQAGKKLTPLEEKLIALDRKNTSPADLQQLLNNVAQQSSQLARQVGNFYSPDNVSGSASKTPNGFVDSGLVGTTSHGLSTPDSRDAKRPRLDPESTDSRTPPVPDTSCQAARCRPVRSYRKRKLLRTSGLHQSSRKASRLSTVRCNCYPPVVPCAMCGARYNNVMQLDPDVMPLPERVALLDPSFHPVLSFTQDVPLSIHFESLLKTGEWQHKQPIKHLKTLQGEKRRVKPQREGVRKYTRRINKSASAAILSSTRIKNKYESHKTLSRRPDGTLLATPKKTLPERTRTRLCRTDVKLRKIPANRRDAMREMKRLLSDMATRSKSSSAPGTPAQDSLSLSGSFSDLRRRRGPNAFDINNIVIPYSMAASTRVEKLQYKEIITPKWREVLERFMPTATNTPGKKKLTKRDLNASDSSTDTADSGPDFLADSGSDSAQNAGAAKTEKLEPVVEPPSTNPEIDVAATSQPVIAKDTRGQAPEVKAEQTEVKSEVQEIKAKAQEVKEEVREVKAQIPEVKTEVTEVKAKTPEVKEQATEDKAASKDQGFKAESTVKSKAEAKMTKPQKVNEERGSSTSSTDVRVAVEVNEENEVEDLSEETCRQRHIRCEVQEKKKFTSYLQMQRRGRGSRTESGTMSPGPITPDSVAADTQHAAATPPATPATVSKMNHDAEDETPNRSASFSSVKSEEGAMRRRTSSVSSRCRSISRSEERRKSFEEYTFPPWPRRAFPLNEFEMESLFMDRPPEPLLHCASIVQEIPGTSNAVRPVFSLDSNPASPLSSGSDIQEEDPNDPEWTVVAEKNPPGQKQCLVLKLAKR